MSDESQPLEFSASDMMPDWATEQSKKPASEGGPARPPRSDRGAGESERRRSDEGGQRGGQRGDDRGRGGVRGRGDSREGGREGRGPGARPPRGDGRGPGPKGGRGRDDDRRGGPRERRRDDDRRDRGRDDSPRETPPPAGVTVALEPTPAALAGLAQHLRETLRTFPLAELAKVVLASRDRYQARFASAPEGPAFYQCLDDRSLWLSREEAVAHFLGGSLIEAYYEVKEVEIEPPKGNFTSVAVCGLSGTILGPSSHHEYQRRLLKLHAERFSHMPVERYLTRIRNESGEEVLERWRASVSRRTEYLPKGSSFEEEPAEEPPAADPEASAEPEEEPAEGAAAEEVEASAETADPEGAIVEVAENADEDAAEAPEAAVEGETGTGTGTEAEPNESEQSDESDAAGSSDEPASALPSLKSWDELVDHFKAHYAEEAIIERREAVVPGGIHGKLLSPGLLALLRSEGERLRRGFPLAMVQALCRGLEGENLRFFKRGKKALHVSAVRPQALDPAVTLTDQVQRIVDHVAAHPRCRVVDLLEALVEGFTRPTKDSPHEAVELPDAAKSVLKDLRWLTAEGFVLEFADTSLVIAKQTPHSPGEGAAKAKGSAASKPAAPRGGREAGGDPVKPAPPARTKGNKRPAAAPASTEAPPVEPLLDPLVALDRDEAAGGEAGGLDELPVSTDPVGEGEAL